MVIVVVCILCVSDSRYTFLVYIVMHIVYRVLSLSLNPMLRTYIQLVKATSFMLTKETAKGHVGLTSPIYRNFDFTKMTSKFGKNWLMKCIVVFSFWGASPPDPLIRGSAPGPRWGHSPQTPIIAPQC